MHLCCEVVARNTNKITDIYKLKKILPEECYNLCRGYYVSKKTKKKINI